MAVYRYSTNIRCHLANGETQDLHDYEVTVEAEGRAAAEASLSAVALDQLADEGPRVADAPVESVDIRRSVCLD